MWKLGGVLCMVAVLSGCATLGSGGGTGTGYRTASQRAIGQCIATVGFGAIAGAIIGRDARKGALVGAGLGAGACAVLLQFAAKEDQEHIRELERQAVAANAARQTSFKTKSGAQAQVQTVVREAPAPEPQEGQATEVSYYTACRYSETTARVNGQAAPAGRQLWCRTDVGDWQPVAG